MCLQPRADGSTARPIDRPCCTGRIAGLLRGGGAAAPSVAVDGPTLTATPAPTPHRTAEAAAANGGKGKGDGNGHGNGRKKR